MSQRRTFGQGQLHADRPTGQRLEAVGDLRILIRPQIGTDLHHITLATRCVGCDVLRLDLTIIIWNQTQRHRTLTVALVADGQRQAVAHTHTARAPGKFSLGNLQIRHLPEKIELPVVHAPCNDAVFLRTQHLPVAVWDVTETYHRIERHPLPWLEGCGIDLDVTTSNLSIFDDAVGRITLEQRGEGSIVSAGAESVFHTDIFLAIFIGCKDVLKRSCVGLFYPYWSFVVEIGERLERLRTGAVLVGLHTDDGILTHAISYAAETRYRMIVIGVEYRKREITITIAAPTPVDMVEAVAVVTVADEDVSFDIARASILHRPSIGQFLINQILPSVDTIIHTMGDMHRILIAEIPDERFYDILRGRTGEFRGIFHLTGLSAVAHQLGHGRLLFGGAF